MKPLTADAVEQVALEARCGRPWRPTRSCSPCRRTRTGRGRTRGTRRPCRKSAVGVRVRDALQEEVVVPDPAVARPEHEREAERVEQDAAQGGVHDALDHDVRDFTGSGEPALEHHEPGLHEEHEERGHQTHAVFSGLTMSTALTAPGAALMRRPGVLKNHGEAVDQADARSRRRSASRRVWRRRNAAGTDL